MKIMNCSTLCIFTVSMLAIQGCAAVDTPDGTGTGMADSTGPTSATRATPAAVVVGSVLPLAIHGAAFIPINISSGTIANYGGNGLAVGTTSTGAVTSATLAAGTPVTQISVRVIDNAGTGLIARFGDANGTIFFGSASSNGSATLQTLVITPTAGFQTVAGDSYWIAVNRASGGGGWLVEDAIIQ